MTCDQLVPTCVGCHTMENRCVDLTNLCLTKVNAKSTQVNANGEAKRNCVDLRVRLIWPAGLYSHANIYGHSSPDDQYIRKPLDIATLRPSVVVSFLHSFIHSFIHSSVRSFSFFLSFFLSFSSFFSLYSMCFLSQNCLPFLSRSKSNTTKDNEDLSTHVWKQNKVLSKFCWNGNYCQRDKRTRDMLPASFFWTWRLFWGRYYGVWQRY